MKKIKKIFFQSTRWLALRRKRMQLYYWADLKVYELRQVQVMPYTYYRLLYCVGMSLANLKGCTRLADWTVHMIPYNIRFHIS